MPSKSKNQSKFMRAVAHSEEFAGKVGVPMGVGKDFVEADKKRGKSALSKLPKQVGTKRAASWRHQGR